MHATTLTTLALAIPALATSALAGPGQIDGNDHFAFQPTAASGQISTLTNIGQWSDPLCRTDNSAAVSLAYLLEGHSDAAACAEEDSTATAQSHAGLTSVAGQLRLTLSGSGNAAGSLETVRSQHDARTDVQFEVASTVRARVDWSVNAEGDAAAAFKLGGDGADAGVDTPDAGSDSPYAAASGTRIFRMDAGVWTMSATTEHDTLAQTSKPATSSASVDLTITQLHPADVDGDRDVDVLDILEVINSWGGCNADDCNADITWNGVVDVEDLREVLASINNPGLSQG